jgi:uncharacterized protein (DUF924 family)
MNASTNNSIHEVTLATQVIHFWFDELEPKQWWIKDPKLDKLIQTRFGLTMKAAASCELSNWRSSPLGRLAEIIVLDQFSRNVYRNTPAAFSQDPLALCLAQQAIVTADDQQLVGNQRKFLYMPFMHSESKFIHQQSIRLFSSAGLEDSLDSALQHKSIIDRFGRYPHRNAILGRESTLEESVFLKQAGSSF